MLKHQSVTSTVRPTRKQRLIELGKDLLIVLLSLSTVFLADRISTVSRLDDWIHSPVESAGPEMHRSAEAAAPYLLAVRNEWGLFGTGYEGQLTQESWNQVSGLLGRALSEADQPVSITEPHWRELLEKPGIYCAFQGEIPLEALGAWLGEESRLTGDARELLLAWDGTSAWLAWRDGGNCYAAAAAVSWNSAFSPVLREFSPNGAAFAYTLAESDGLYKNLDPYVLVQMNPPEPPELTGSSPDLLGDRELLRNFLNRMGFESGGDTAYETPEGLALSEGGDRLRVNREGLVLYHAGEESRYPVASAGEVPTRQEAARAAWELAARALSGWKGEGRLVLTGSEPTEKGWLVTLHVRFNGIPIMIGDTGWAAQVRVDGREISYFSIHLRAYTPRDVTTPIPRERLAAAALPSLEREGGRLMLRYIDSHTDTVKAGWVVEFP